MCGVWCWGRALGEDWPGQASGRRWGNLASGADFTWRPALSLWLERHEVIGHALPSGAVMGSAMPRALSLAS